MGTVFLQLRLASGIPVILKENSTWFEHHTSKKIIGFLFVIIYCLSKV